MVRTIAFCNHKGGVGKTTSTASIGVAMARQGKKVLLVDLDGQANLTGIFVSADQVEKSIYNALVEKEALPIISIEKDLDMVPSDLNMSAAEVKMSGLFNREMRLTHILAKVKGNYDYILIDCPPSLGVVTINAFFAADDIYVPISPEILPLKGMMMIENVLEDLREAKPELSITGVFITRFDSRKNINKAVEEEVRKQYANVIFNTHIRDNVSLSECPGANCSIFDYDTKSKGAQDYLNLTREILERNK